MGFAGTVTLLQYSHVQIFCMVKNYINFCGYLLLTEQTWATIRVILVFAQNVKAKIYIIVVNTMFWINAVLVTQKVFFVNCCLIKPKNPFTL